MEYRRLGSSDLRASAIGIGGYPFGPPLLDQAMTRRVLDQALAEGVNFIDTSDIYGEGKSEELVGDAIKGKRDRFIVATKFNLRDLAGETPRQRITRKCEESLRNLQTEHIDLYQVHHAAPSVPSEEILRPLDDLVRQGKVRHIGTCNYASWRHLEALATARQHGLARSVSTQNHYNLLHRHAELELLPFCKAYQVGFIPYFPLAGGFLTGAYRPGEPPPPGSRAARVPTGIVSRIRSPRTEALLVKLEGYAKERGHTVGELALAWLLAHPEVSVVITGADRPEHVRANVRAVEWRLTPEEKRELDSITAWWDGADAAIDSTGPTPQRR
jgi:aryl-alcohol dehydrogenase-like predicted oxidoreductase